MKKFPFNTFLMRFKKANCIQILFWEHILHILFRDSLSKQNDLFRERQKDSQVFFQIFNLKLFEKKKKFLAKKIYPSNLIDLFVLRIIYSSYIAIFIVCNIPYNCTDDRKMSITCENDDKTARRSFVYKIPGRYFRCNAFSQIRGCPSLGTKSHGSISRAKALHAREISKRCQYGLNL